MKTASKSQVEPRGKSTKKFRRKSIMKVMPVIT